MWALHTCGWKMLPWWLLWPEHSSEVRSGSIHRDNKIGRGEVKVEEVEIIALFQERNMRKLQSIHSYRQMASCPWRKKKKKNQLCLSGKIYTVKYSLSSSNNWGQGRKNNTLIFFFFTKRQKCEWLVQVFIWTAAPSPGTSCLPLWWGFVHTPHVPNTISTVLRLLTLRSCLSLLKINFFLCLNAQRS